MQRVRTWIAANGLALAILALAPATLAGEFPSVPIREGAGTTARVLQIVDWAFGELLERIGLRTSADRQPVVALTPQTSAGPGTSKIGCEADPFGDD